MKRINLPAATESLIGVVPDLQLARQFDVAKHTIRRRREERHLPAVPRQRQVNWDDPSTVRDFKRDRQRAIRRDHPERVRENDRRRSKRKRRREWVRQNYRQNRERIISRIQARRVGVARAEAADRPALAAFYRLSRSDTVIPCYWCKRKTRNGTRDVDHIVSLRAGGKHTILNVCIACKRCNRSKRAKAPEEFSGQHELFK